MTQRLEQAFAEAAKLSPEEQDQLAEWMLRDLLAERRWQQAFAGSQDALSRLADEALCEHRAAQTEPLDPDRL